MIVDSSAIVAILDQEDDLKKFYTALTDSRHTNTMSVTTLLEVTIIVCRSKDALHRQQVDQLIRDFGILFLCH
jgi:uncharacterized protein with PIN domain